MKKFSLAIFCTIFCTLSCQTGREPRTVILLDEQWLFYRNDIPNGETVSLQDSGWQRIDVPHDWSIEDLPGMASPFDSAVVDGVHNGFTRGGTGWYRKHFQIGKENAGQRIFIRFDGVYMNSDIWINERHVCNHFYGYTGFQFDITDFVKFGEDNLIAVRVENETVRSRWYCGSGIYRHVWLTIASPLHVEPWGTAITTSGVSNEAATVKVVSNITNRYPGDKKANIRYTIRNKNNEVVAQSDTPEEINGNGKKKIKHSLQVGNPQLWSIETPFLYSLETEIMLDRRVVDRTTETFGIRTIQFDAEHGFRLNGKQIKLKGGCIHHDNGPLGSVALDRAEERKVELHKAAGFNALRTAHNPPSPALLDACDRLGMVVIDEAFDVWRYGYFEGDYATFFDSLWRGDLENMIVRDRNHPSVIMWSIGNEIKKARAGNDTIAALCGEMSRFVKSIDDTRPVTSTECYIIDRHDSYFSHLDVCGYQYSPERYLIDHQRHPSRIICSTESFPINAYDNWKAVEEYPWVIGDFVWTSFDYIGETSLGWLETGSYPWVLAYCGDMDICGNRRPQSCFRQTLWEYQPVVHIFVRLPEPSFPLPEKVNSRWVWPDVAPCWNFEGYEQKLFEVSVYSQCSEVELFLNGKSLGKMVNDAQSKNILLWQVPYSAGELKAVGYNDGKEVASTILQTAGRPAKIVLTADRDRLLSNGDDLSYIKVQLVDEHGILNPVADNLVQFEINGTGKLAAVANANPTSVESFRQPERHAWRGECMAIIRSGKETGEIRLTAKIKGLPETTITIYVE